MAVPRQYLSPPQVHKFGGSSVADADGFRRVAAIVTDLPATSCIVVSAVAGVTNRLVAIAAAAASRQDWQGDLDDLRYQHRHLAQELLGSKSGDLHEFIDDRFAALARHLGALSVLGVATELATAPVHGAGELLSSRILHALLQKQGQDAAWLDARKIVVLETGDAGKTVNWDASRIGLDGWRHWAKILVAPGFVASDDTGRMVTLGRNGSDYSAAILARLLDAESLSLWGDTDGVQSADPSLVPDAVQIAQLSYDEAFELAYYGARVIHPQTLAPLLANKIPLHIRNVNAPERAGTHVGPDLAAAPVKGLTAMQNLGLVTLEGSGMVGVTGIDERVFAALRQASVSVVMVSQGSSEHSICCVVQRSDCEPARRALLRAFAWELETGDVNAISVDTDIAVLAAVGDGMVGTPGTAARLLSALAHAGINVRAIAQGASERNISLAVAGGDVQRALRAAHAGFWLSAHTLSIGLIGAGRVGGELLEQLKAARQRLRREAGVDLRIRAVAGSRRMWLGEAEDAPAALDDSIGEALDLERLVDHVQADHLPHAVLIDCTAADEISAHYPAWLKRGIHIATPNKHAGAGDIGRWKDINQARQNGSLWRYEGTVGAGLPVIQTLRDLLDTGDELVSIEAVLSGSMAWLCNSHDGRRPFSELVAEARRQGYTEPDPREDLSGMDVARKLVILAREAGQPLTLQDVQVESLVQPELAAAPLNRLDQALPLLDKPMQQWLDKARQQGGVLRHVARLDKEGRASVGLAILPADHAFAHLRFTDNCVQFSTRRYCNNPLVVQGPGAGPEVTAAGVFADVLRIAGQLGAPL